MSKKNIGYILYAIGGVWALYCCSWDDSYWMGMQYIPAFFIAAIFGIIGTIFVVSKTSQNEKGNEKNNDRGAEELLKFKKLYDDGVINEDEFNKKKKEILGL